MSLWSRIANVFRGDRLSREIDEELASHIEAAIEDGRNPAEARRALGSGLRQREASHDIRVARWLDSLRSDAVFGWRQLMKKKVTSTAAILSLAVAMGASTAAFRLIDALLVRPLPVSAPERLYVLVHRGIDFDGSFETDDSWTYPMFSQMRAAVKDRAELIAISYPARIDLTYRSEQEAEKAYQQYDSGGMFSAFGLRPVLGRLLTTDDDLQPGAHPVAVLSYEYWTRRFARNPQVLGRRFHFGSNLYTIVGVVRKPFTGTVPGTMIDIFVPMMMSPNVGRSDLNWFRTLVHFKPGASLEPVRERLRATYRSFREKEVKTLTGFPKQTLDGIVHQKLLLYSAATGVSGMQEEYREPLTILSVLVGLLLLIATANVANLMTAQAAARGREMALRVAIGAGRSRLIQLVLVESLMLALFASSFGAMLAWWSAPFVLSRINPPDNPARLLLPADWRVLFFGIALTFVVALLFGLAPALRASGIKPAAALKGGEDPHSRRRSMHVLIGAQVAFCFLVLFVAGLFVATLDRLSHQPTGFSADRLLTLETVAERGQPPAYWDQVIGALRAIPGVEAVALADWPLLSATATGGYVSVDGGRPFEIPAYFLDVSPGWMHVMGIPFTAGRDFRASDAYPRAAIVNEAFVKQFFKGANALAKSFDTAIKGKRTRVAIVGLVRNARYGDLREPVLPVAYFPFRSINAEGAPLPKSSGTFIVRTFGASPLALETSLRRGVSRAGPELRITNLRTQAQIDGLHTMRERLLAMLALFFAAVALLLAGIGLYGVLNYSVIQRRREIGIRMAVGARAGHIGKLIAVDIISMVAVGALVGLGLGMATVRYIESLLYQVKATDLNMLAVPSLAILAAALLAAAPALIHAVRIDPVSVLRAE